MHLRSLIHKGLLFFTFCLSALITFSQEKLYISYFEAINLPEVYANSTTKIYKNHLSRTGRFSIIPLATWDSTIIVENSKKARERAEVLGATYYVIGEVNKLGSLYQVSIMMHRTADGSLIWQMTESAGSENDLHLILQQLAEKTGAERTFESEKNLYHISDSEAEKRELRDVLVSFGISLGTSYPFIESDEMLASGLGLDLSFDTDNLIFDLNLDGFYSDRNTMGYFSIDVRRPFGVRPNCFFGLAGFGYGSLSYYSTRFIPANFYSYPSSLELSQSGSIAFLGGGYILNRDNRAQVHFTLKGFYGLFDLAMDGRPLDQPIGVIFTTALTFTAAN